MTLGWFVYITTVGGESYLEGFESKSEMNTYLADVDDGDLAEVLIISGYVISHRKK